MFLMKINYTDLKVNAQKIAITSDPLLIDRSTFQLHAGLGTFLIKSNYVFGVGIQAVGVTNFWEEVRITTQLGKMISDEFEIFGNVLYQPKLKSLVLTLTGRYYFLNQFYISTTFQKDTFHNFQTIGYHVGWFRFLKKNKTKNRNLDIVTGVSFPLFSPIKTLNPSWDLKLTLNLEKFRWNKIKSQATTTR